MIRCGIKRRQLAELGPNQMRMTLEATVAVPVAQRPDTDVHVANNDSDGSMLQTPHSVARDSGEFT